jgi:DNA-directed RNA polymerase subunit RPC12/RpoP
MLEAKIYKCTNCGIKNYLVKLKRTRCLKCSGELVETADQDFKGVFRFKTKIGDEK